MNILPTLPTLLALIKCSGSPLIDVGGAYIPSWLVCMALGILGTWLSSVVLERLEYGNLLHPHGIMIPALFALITLWSWLFYFAAR
ncbi:MAG: hypothetical protein K2W99_07855 [Chthoniobacterales bacterium]|nr:hypothetical protein [Chthoniobacterales bacterium]